MNKNNKQQQDKSVMSPSAADSSTATLACDSSAEAEPYAKNNYLIQTSTVEQRNLDALKAAGLDLNTRTRAIAKRPGMRPEYIAARAKEKFGQPTGVLVAALERDDPTCARPPTPDQIEEQLRTNRTRRQVAERERIGQEKRVALRIRSEAMVGRAVCEQDPVRAAEEFVALKRDEPVELVRQLYERNGLNGWAATVAKRILGSEAFDKQVRVILETENTNRTYGGGGGTIGAHVQSLAHGDFKR